MNSFFMATKLKFTTTPRSPFLVTLRGRVDAYITQRALSPHANGTMWAKALFFLLGYGLLYRLILSNLFGAGPLLVLAVLLGVFGACIGFNVSHDALHGAFSDRPWVNKRLGNNFYLLGVYNLYFPSPTKAKL
jgi:linoleoyl-CoA desaturase